MPWQGIRVDGSLKQSRILGYTEIQRADIRDCDPMGIATNDFNPLTGIHFARFDHGKIKAAPPAHQEALDHVVVVKSKR